jgi:signal transduction histidine kinase
VSPTSASLRRPARLGLRARTLVSFGLIALLTSLMAGIATYTFTRNNLVEQRENTVRSQAFNNAQLMRTYLQTRRNDAGRLITTVRTETNGYAILKLTPEDDYYASDPLRFTQDDLPTHLEMLVSTGESGTQRFTHDNVLHEAIGVPIPAVGAEYFEVFSLRDTERTLGFILSALVAGLIVATATAISLGWFTSRRLLRPVGRVADAASDIASGRLDARLEPENDPDLNRLAVTFNEMADTLQERIEREVRFASDVSHELRSPITALSAAVEVLVARRSELSDRNQQALDVIATQVKRFDRMVIDLLELSRLDSGTGSVRLESVDLTDILRRLCQRFGFGDVPVVTSGSPIGEVATDRLRFERIVVNFLTNAREHAGGATAIRVEGRATSYLICVEDNGPGLPLEERQRVFNRFARGAAAQRGTGTGLGLAIAVEHAKTLGGTVWAEDNPQGGMRFCVELPINDDVIHDELEGSTR